MYRTKKYQKTRVKKAKEAVLFHYSESHPFCTCCGEDTIEFLEIHHENNDGALHRKALNITGGWSFYEYLASIGFPTGYSVLCTNCNTAIFRHGVCPHQKGVLQLVKSA